MKARFIILDILKMGRAGALTQNGRAVLVCLAATGPLSLDRLGR
jgi:hypothetical protein